MIGFDWAESLQRQRTLGLYRNRRTLQGAQGVAVQCEGRAVTNFSSNDYLGLANHPGVVAAFIRGVECYGVGAGASHLICGHTAAHQQLEEELADFVGCDRALLFSTGYMANLGVIAALAGRGTVVLEDRLNHASLLDGGVLSRSRLKRYAHADTAALEEVLMTCRDSETLVVSDGVFSMDGDLAPLPELVRVSQAAGACLMIDDAHGLGVLGQNGGGTLEHFGLQGTAVPVLMGTLGKALGTFGAFVAGTSDLIDTLVQTARTYLYTTALPPAVAEATRAALRLARSEGWRRERLALSVARFRDGARALGLCLTQSSTPIQPVLIGGNRDATAAADALLEQGFWVSAIRPPTVPEGSARLRITFSAGHDERDIDGLLSALERLPRECWLS